jgi:hypothetical protein
MEKREEQLTATTIFFAEHPKQLSVHPQLHFTHQQLLHFYTTFVPGLYQIKATVVAFKDKGNL